LADAREMTKPIDHGEITDAELLKDLKKKFMENHEATGMSVKQFHDSMVSDQRARFVLWENYDKFVKWYESGKILMEGNVPVFTMRETLDGFIDDHSTEMTNQECLAAVIKAGHG
jgi:hypothetical protein